MPAKSPDYPISVRQAAVMVEKSPDTLGRWKRSKPVLFRAVMEWCSMQHEMGRK